MAKPLPDIALTGEEKKELEHIINKRTSSYGLVTRARIILLAAQLKSTEEIMHVLSVSKTTVIKWRHNFMHKRLDGLQDEPRSGRKPVYDENAIAHVISTTLKPPASRTHWSTREMAKVCGMAHMTVHRIWKKQGLKPHQVKHFKYSTDTLLTEKVIDIVGLYLHPPDNALVLCVDEKSQIHAYSAESFQV